MMYVLDTNVVSEIRKVRSGKAAPNVTAWAESIDAADLFVSAITIMELELGVYRTCMIGALALIPLTHACSRRQILGITQRIVQPENTGAA